MKFDSSTPIATTSIEAVPICRLASITNITISAPGATMDSVSLNTGDRVLLAGQTVATQNGFYVWNGAAVAMTRSNNVSVRAGMLAIITEGTNFATKQFQLLTSGTILLDTTSLTFAIVVYTPDFILQNAGIT